MSRNPDPFTAHQRARWRRHDAHLWIRHDAARFRRPGSGPADGYRALARERDAEAEEARQFNAAIEQARARLAVLRIELAEIKADMARRRLAQQTKYSPTQPRVPAGNPRGGQWSDGSGGGGQATGLALPMGNADVGDLSATAELTDLFQITPSDTSIDGVQLAADFNQFGSDGKPVTDIDGSSYYAPKGHHEMPKGVYSKWDLSPETEKIFDQSTTGKLPRGLSVDDDGILKGHYWNGPKGEHGNYNDAVGELSDKFMRERNITPREMTPDEARDLLKEIRESDDPRIRNYNRMIRMLGRVFRFRGGRE